MCRGFTKIIFHAFRASCESVSGAAYRSAFEYETESESDYECEYDYEHEHEHEIAETGLLI